MNDPVAEVHPTIDEDDLEHAWLWERDEQARDIAEQAALSLREHVDLRHPSWKARRVLDVGCGTGLLTAHLAPFVNEVVAVDTAPAMLSVLRQKELPNVSVQHADIDDPRLASATWFRGFDLVVASCVFGLLPNYAATVNRLATTLSPTGILVHWDWLIDAEGEDDEDDDGLELERVTNAMGDAGLTVVHLDETFEPLFDADRPLLMAVAMKLTIVG